MLFWHKHNLERAVLDLANFTPFPDEWTVEDKVLFEQAFQFHGKSFHRIRQMVYIYNIYNFIYLFMLQLYSLYYIYIRATFYLLNFTKNFLYEFILI